MKTGFLKYILTVVILFALLERNYIPVFSWLQVKAYALNETKAETADGAKESETVKEASLNDCIHHFFAYRFTIPVTSLAAESRSLYKTKFPFCFYPDVPTPPPNA